MDPDLIGELRQMRERLLEIHKEMQQRYPDEAAEISSIAALMQNATGDMMRTDMRRAFGNP